MLARSPPPPLPASPRPEDADDDDDNGSDDDFGDEGDHDLPLPPFQLLPDLKITLATTRADSDKYVMAYCLIPKCFCLKIFILV